MILYNVILTAGPQHREFRKEILQAMRVGEWAPTQRISKRNSTSNASWTRSPNWISNFYKQYKFMLAHTKCNLSVT
ncbi:hypothetical protein HMPREF3281_02460 [Staphylococcus sp. HMSC73A05]|nr:hypothetical protein HMPREF3281_02460 [Staphylococcus sp. HMSC73A05]